MGESEINLKEVADAFERFTRTTQAMEEAYRRLELRVHELNAELEEKNRALELTKDYLNYVLESITDGVIAVDIAEIVTTCNAAACRILGFHANEIIGRRFRELFGREFLAPPGRQIMELLTKDGRCIRIAETNSPLTASDNRRLGTVKVFQDLTEVEDLREKIRHMDRLAAVGEMAATVAHEIRNPLGGIRGFAALLAREIGPGDSRQRLVEKILAGTRSMEEVVTELLEYTRPIQLRLRSASCADIVDAAVGYVDLGGRPIAIENSVNPEARALVDSDRMRQVFLNILLNAVQSIDGEGRVRISSTNGDNVLSIAIADTGCGMTKDQRERVFSPFYTTKEKGTGLGLAVAARIVEVHGGTIDVESEPGAGSTFCVRLPKAE